MTLIDDKTTLTVLGFDFGMKMIGVAVGQTLTHTATPLLSIKAKDGIPNWSEINELIVKYNANALVVGVPLNMDGSEQPITFCAKRFIKRLYHHTRLPIYSVDERLSSFEAKDRLYQEKKSLNLKSKKDLAMINANAAAILIEQWFNEKD